LGLEFRGGTWHEMNYVNSHPLAVNIRDQLL